MIRKHLVYLKEAKNHGVKKIQDDHFRPKGSGRVRTLGIIFQEFPPLESFYIVILIYLGI